MSSGQSTARSPVARAGSISDEASLTCDLAVGGMDCASCAASIESALRSLDGVEDIQVNVVGGRVRVRYADARVGRTDIAGAINRAGFTVRADSDDAPAQRHHRARLAAAAASGLFLSAGLIAGWLHMPEATRIALLVASTIAGGWFVAPRGIRGALNRTLDMNFLMTVAATGAWIIGENSEAAATLFLFSVAELLESYSMDRARNAIAALMEIAPPEARVRRGGREELIPVEQIEVGETVIVRPGEKLAVDGVVTLGRSSVNQAPITGESMPVEKEPGAQVFAGSLNEHGALEIRSTRPASDTTLARIIHAVEEAQASRAPTQRFVDRFARIYTPAVVAVAVLLAVGPPLAGLGTWQVWIYRALAMLVVACPCALVISTPVSIVSGLAGAARNGILIKGGAHLENLGRVTSVAIDKTGTLTEGRPAVTDVLSLSGNSEESVLLSALGVERHSEHPLARAVMEHAQSRGVGLPESSGFESLPGRGARAIVRGRQVHLANSRLALELGLLDGPTATAMSRFESAGKTAVLVAGDRGAGVIEPLGVIAIADRPRINARGAISDLRGIGVRHVLMLTGDNTGTAEAIASRVGIDDSRAGLLPDDKVRIVRELLAAGERVAFVGDGVNDAPALAAATVGVAMGVAGTDVALEAADVALMGDDLTKVALAIRFSRATLRIIRQNIAISLLIKAVFLVLVVGGWATLWMAVGADMGGSLLVVGNGLRARRLPA